MESFRRPGGRRVLLPAEIELCETIGITEDEYWYFVELTQAYNGKRPKEYDEIPYVVNGFVATFIGSAMAGNIGAQLLLGIILTVVSILLAPKPRAPKTPPSLTTAGQTGPKRFAPQTGFNSVQELAKLGEIVPLVFTKQETEIIGDYKYYYGGVRVNTRLLWSQMISLGTGQQLKALFMIGLADLAAKPEFAGYAIGDLLLKNYINKKLALYIMTDGGRPQEGPEKYSEGTLEPQVDRNNSKFRDVMSVDWDEQLGAIDTIVSSARTPNTQVQFGAYSPMPNSMRYRVPYELVLKQKNLKSDNKRDIDKKRQKLRTNFPRYASIVNYNGSDTNRNSFNVEKNKDIQYTIGDMDSETQYGEEFDPWGVEDVKSAVNASREESDDAIQVGESYLIGSALAVCIKKSRPIWTPEHYQDCTFRVDTPGKIDVRSGTEGLQAAHSGYQLLTLQKVAIGTISNSKVCDVTEIGLKSKVFKQVTSFPNVNSHPGAVGWNEQNADTTEGVVKRYNDDDGNISLGGMSKYLTRYSFFRLQARVAGVGEADWNYIDQGIPFGIRGNSPQPQYNFIRINHRSTPKKEYEFRFLPFPGNLIKRDFVDRNNPVRILSSAGELLSYEISPNEEVYNIYFKGSQEKLRSGDVSNTEWYLGDLPTDVDGGKVNRILETVDGTIPQSTRWIEVDRKTSNMDANLRSEAVIFYKTQNYGSTWVWSTRDRPPHWSAYFGNRNQTINGPLRNPNTITIGDPYVHPYYEPGDGFRYGVGPHIQTFRGRPKNRRGEYYGIIKYEMLTRDVDPIVHENISTSTSGNGSGLTVNIKVYLSPINNQYAAATWEINQRGSGYKDSDRISIPATGNFPGKNNIDIVTDFSEFVSDPWPEGKNLNPFDALSDYYQYDAERSSHQDGPEHEIVYVNEQSNLGSPPPYAVDNAGIANVALRLSSSKEWNSFSQFSAYIKEGIKVENIAKGRPFDVPIFGPTNLFPEIVYALLTDKKFGLANSIGVSSVDKDRMVTAAKFCEANKFYWDGVITDKQNVREFIYQNAVFNFLDFTILGGKFSLFPSVPFNPSTYVIEPTQKPLVRALFTDGNTRNLKVSFLSPEERQNFIGTAYFRREVPNGFSETESITLAVAEDDLLTQSDIEKLPIEVFDMSDFCTTQNHAEEFLQHALMIRKKVDHGIKFETTPQAALGLKPGDYIRFISEATHTSRFENGVISSDGVVQSVGNNSLTNVNIYHWKPGTEEVKESNLNVVDGYATNANLYGSVFTVKQTSESNRLYKVESITYTDEGLIELSGSHAPLLSDGTLATINYDPVNDFTGV